MLLFCAHKKCTAGDVCPTLARNKITDNTTHTGGTQCTRFSLEADSRECQCSIKWTISEDFGITCKRYNKIYGCTYVWCVDVNEC